MKTVSVTNQASATGDGVNNALLGWCFILPSSSHEAVNISPDKSRTSKTIFRATRPNLRVTVVLESNMLLCCSRGTVPTSTSSFVFKPQPRRPSQKCHDEQKRGVTAPHPWRSKRAWVQLRSRHSRRVRERTLQYAYVGVRKPVQVCRSEP